MLLSSMGLADKIQRFRNCVVQRRAHAIGWTSITPMADVCFPGSRFTRSTQLDGRRRCRMRLHVR